METPNAIWPVINRITLFYASSQINCQLLSAFSHFSRFFLASKWQKTKKMNQIKDGQTLPINRRQRAYNNGTLIIEQLQRLEDAGTYTCMAQNKQKQTSRRNVEIQVLGEFLFFRYLKFESSNWRWRWSCKMDAGKQPLQLLQ